MAHAGVHGREGLAPGPLSPSGLGLGAGDGTPRLPGRDHAGRALRLPGGGSDVFSSTQRENLARRITFEVAAYLLAEHAAFAKAFLGGLSYEVHGRHTARLVGPQAWAQGLALATWRGRCAVWCANAAVTDAVPDPVAACSLGCSLGQALAVAGQAEPPGNGLRRSRPAATQERR